MLTQEQYVEIHVLHRQGKKIREIARLLGISKNTVKKHLRLPLETPSYTPRPPKESVLDPFKGYLQGRIKAAEPNWIPGTVLFREIQERGYIGGYTTVKTYLATLRPPKVIEPDNRFETPPGQQMQVDFTTIRRGRDPVKALVATLGSSRSSFVKFYRRERQEDWLDGIELAFHHFQGVPLELLFDNAKCIMLDRDYYGRAQHRWNPDLLSLAKFYNFSPRACRPYRARTKGKVERFNHHLKNSFVYPLMASMKQVGLHFDVEVANAHIGPWLIDVPDQRIHGTTKEKPADRLAAERIALQALPDRWWQSKIDPPLAPNSSRVTPIESLQHPLSIYDEILEVRS